MTPKQIVFFLVFFLTASLTSADPAPSDIKETVLSYKDGTTAPDDTDPDDPSLNFNQMENRNGENNQWRAVGQMLNAKGEPHCSSTLVKIPNCNRKNVPAIQLTAGHCNASNEVAKKVAFGRFKGMGLDETHQANIAANLYSNYAHGSIDLGIMQLDQTYEQLDRVGIKPFEIANEPLPYGARIRNVSTPSQADSIKDPADRVMRETTCTVGRKTTLIDTTEMWPNATELRGCSAKSGSSGSCLCDSGKLYGILTVANREANVANPSKDVCFKDSCIYDGKNPPRVEANNYGFSVTNLNRCFKDCKLDTKLPGCMLPDAESKINIGRIRKYDELGNNWLGNLNQSLNVRSGFAGYRVKGCKQGQRECDCSDPVGYSSTQKTQSIKPADYLAGVNPQAASGAAPQFYYLCLRGVKADGTLDDMKNVTNYPIYHYSGRVGGGEDGPIHPNPVLPPQPPTVNPGGDGYSRPRN